MEILCNVSSSNTLPLLCLGPYKGEEIIMHVLVLRYEKYKTSEGNTAYAFIGYSTVYQFYVYPEQIRPRVAQMLILPPFQRQGLGSELLSAIYGFYRSNPAVKEITGKFLSFFIGQVGLIKMDKLLNFCWFTRNFS